MPPSRSFSALAAAVVSALALPAHAADHYVATNGSDSAAGTLAAPYKTIAKGIGVANPGDTVWVRGGTYSGSVFFTKSGSAGSYLTVSAYPGELPVVDGGGSSGSGFSSSSATYVKFVGLAVRNFGSSAFSNGWVNDTGTSNGNWQIVNCVADDNGINGIAFYNASGILIDESIVAHNGNVLPSWSSGVNLFHVSGGYANNVVRRTVSFENVDISSNHTDGSGFILDQNSDGATFENNLGFRNGGSCIRITNSTGVHLVNNTCYHDGLDANDVSPNNPGEIYAWPPLAAGSAVLVNNLLAASGWNGTMTALSNVAGGSNDVAVNANGATPFFVNPGALDFRLLAGSSAEIDAGTSSNAPATDLGFDPKCITAQAGALAFWAFAPDYTYIASVGGVAGCFNPSARPIGAAVDIGAYEYQPATTTGCTSASDCNDGNACTTDGCNAQTGACTHAAVSGCCTNASDCNDGDACTTDSCGGNTCAHTSVAGCCKNDAGCNDGDACTTDSCDLGTHTCKASAISGCCDADADCGGASTCVTVSCNRTTHACASAPVPGCCTKDADCNDGDACTTDACDTSSGACTNALVAACCTKDGDCADDDACTVDTCNTSTNRCGHAAPSGCCTAASQCNDGNACTLDSCDAETNRCAHSADPACAAGGTGGVPAAGAPSGGADAAGGAVAMGGLAAGGRAGSGSVSAGGVSGGAGTARGGGAGGASAGAMPANGGISGAISANGSGRGGASVSASGGAGRGAQGSAGALTATAGTGAIAAAGNANGLLEPNAPDPPGAFDCTCSTPRERRGPWGYLVALGGLVVIAATRRRASETRSRLA